LAQEKASATARIELLDRNNETLKEYWKTVKHDLEKGKAPATAQIDAWIQSNKTLRDDLYKAKCETTLVREEAENRLASLTGDCEELQGELELAEEHLATARAGTERLSQKITSLEQDLQTAKQSLASLKATYNTKVQDSNDVKTKLLFKTDALKVTIVRFEIA